MKQITRREFSQLISAMFAMMFMTGTAAPNTVAGMDLQKKTSSKKVKRGTKDNTSYWKHRISDDITDDWKLIEKGLADEWVKWNECQPGLNYGCGILQDLMIGTARHERPENFDPELSDRERKIVATVIQWLGTNVGRSFLHEASRRMGRPSYPFPNSKEA